MPELDPVPQSHLFTLRIWFENLEHDQQVWRGRIQHVASGETRHFQSWEMLIQELTGLMGPSDSSP